MMLTAIGIYRLLLDNAHEANTARAAGFDGREASLRSRGVDPEDLRFCAETYTLDTIAQLFPAAAWSAEAAAVCAASLVVWFDVGLRVPRVEA